MPCDLVKVELAYCSSISHIQVQISTQFNPANLCIKHVHAERVFNGRIVALRVKNQTKGLPNE